MSHLLSLTPTAQQANIQTSPKVLQNQLVNGLDVFDIAAGQNTTVFLVKSSSENLDMIRLRWTLLRRGIGYGRDYGDLLECDKRDGLRHLECLNPH